MHSWGGEKRLPRAVAGGALVVSVLAMVVHNRLVPFPTSFFGLTENGYDLDTYRAAVRGLWDGKRLYEAPALNKAWFVYPPFATLVLAPLAWASFGVAKWVLLTLSVAALALIAWRILRLAGIRADARLAVVSAALAVILIDIEPVQATVWWGQVNILLMAMVLLDLLRPVTARGRGIGLGLAAGIKLTPLIFLPYLLLTRQWRASAIATGTFAATAALTWPVLPRDSSWFWSHLGDTAHISRIDHLANQSINGFLARYFLPHVRPEWLWITLSLLVLVAGLAVAVWAHRRGGTGAGGGSGGPDGLRRVAVQLGRALGLVRTGDRLACLESLDHARPMGTGLALPRGRAVRDDLHVDPAPSGARTHHHLFQRGLLELPGPAAVLGGSTDERLVSVGIPVLPDRCRELVAAQRTGC